MQVMQVIICSFMRVNFYVAGGRFRTDFRMNWECFWFFNDFLNFVVELRILPCSYAFQYNYCSRATRRSLDMH